jgi:pSer/pThr/pTyr-binding forkhead associated (FHA) protein
MHAALVCEGDAIYLVDLNSTNGTCLNHERIPPGRPCRLHSGDIIRLGLLEIMIEFVV